MCLRADINEVGGETSEAALAVCTAVCRLRHLEVLVQPLHRVLERLPIYLEFF